MRHIGFRIQNRTQPGEPGNNAGADVRRILADARSEHERIEPAQCRRQHAGMKRDAITEVLK